MSSNQELLFELDKLRQELKAVNDEKAALEILLEMTNEHTDAVEADLARDSKNKLAQFIEAVPVGVLVLDEHYQIDFMNQRAQQLLGKEIMPEASIEELFQASPFYLAGTEQLYPKSKLPGQRALQGESLSLDDIEIHRSDKIIPIEVWATPVFDHNQQVIYATLVFQDITERKRAEAERLLLIQEREAKNAALRMNKKIEAQKEKLAYTLEQLQKSHQKLIESEKRAALGQVIANIAHELNTPLGSLHSSVTNISHFLTHTLENLSVFLQLLPQKHQQDFLVLLEKSSIQSVISLSSKEKRQYRRALIQQFAEYEIDNPENIADTLVEIGIYQNIEFLLPLLKNRHGTKALNLIYQIASLQKNVYTVGIASKRISKVIFALKSFTRQEQKHRWVQANLIDGLETVLTLYYNQIVQGVTVVRNYTQLPLVRCIPEELNQVWMNVILNALQAMNNKGTLQIDTSVNDIEVLIKITDSGSGIPESIQSTLFEPFVTTKAVGEGSGLGLNIVKKIMDKHQGQITFTSEPNQTTFNIYLPLIHLPLEQKEKENNENTNL